MTSKLTFFLFALLTNLAAMAQDSTAVTKSNLKMYAIETIDGASITGTVIMENDTLIILNSKSLGSITILRKEIKSIKLISSESFRDGNYWFENPNATRYLIGPTGFCLKKGEGYYQNLYVFGQSFNVGITDHISIGGGTEIASLIFGGEAPSVVFLTPKIGFNINPKLNVGAGILYVNSRDLIDDANNLAIAYGVATIGSLDNNFTLGLGWGYHHNRVFVYTPYQDTYKIEQGLADKPIVTFSGMTRLTKRFALTTENWITPIKDETYDYIKNSYTTTYPYRGLFSYGMRFMGDKNSIDVGFINNADIADELIIGVPYIDFVIKFGENKKDRKKQ